MGRRSTFTLEEKLNAIYDYIEGKNSATIIALEIGCDVNTLCKWVNRYRAVGESAFLNRPKNNSYTKEFKQMIVDEYLAGGCSCEILAIKYDIPSGETIRKWIILYNSHGEQKDYNPKGEVYMAKARKTTLQERIDIVNHCMANNKQYKLTAEKFQISYNQAYQWVNKFVEQGEEGLLDNRGKRKAEDTLSETEKLQQEVKRLKHQLEMKERESILLKKVREIEGRLYSQKANKNQNT